MSHPKSLYGPPPPYRPTNLDHPVILVAYWCSMFALAIIFARIAGRYIRTLRVHKDDKWMAISIVPLLVRLGLAHVVLVFGTNNTDFTAVMPRLSDGHGEQPVLSLAEWDEEQRRRAIGSKVVLVARIAFVAFIWSQKICITEFYLKLTVSLWNDWYTKSLEKIRWLLLGTFVAITITIIAECNPFDHYWQLVPDPGPQCRQAVAPLLFTVVCNVITDALLIIFPMLAVIRSRMPFKRKFFLVLSLSLPLLLIAMSLYMIPFMRTHRWAQPQRTLYASLECLASCAVANAVVLNSFIRDKGPKRHKYRGPGGHAMLYTPENIRNRGADMHDSIDKITLRKGIKLWGSDEDLIKGSGIGMDGELRKLSEVHIAVFEGQPSSTPPPTESPELKVPDRPYLAPWNDQSAESHQRNYWRFDDRMAVKQAQGFSSMELSGGCPQDLDIVRVGPADLGSLSTDGCPLNHVDSWRNTEYFWPANPHSNMNDIALRTSDLNRVRQNGGLSPRPAERGCVYSEHQSNSASSTLKLTSETSNRDAGFSLTPSNGNNKHASTDFMELRDVGGLLNNTAVSRDLSHGTVG